MTIQLARCHICAALLADTPDDRRQHVAVHNHDEKVADGIRKALKDAAAKILELRQETTDLRRELEEANVPLEPATPTGEALTIVEIPDEDLDAELEDDDEPLETHDDTDLADEADITTQLAAAGVTAADLAAPVYPAIDRDDDDDLDLRIARQTGAIA